MMMPMRIACPSCAAEYDVPERLLAGPSQMLRCSRCAAEFALPDRAAPEPEPAPEPEAKQAAPPPPEPEPEPEPAIPQEEAPRQAPAAGSPATLVWAWAASFVVLAGAVAVLVVFREAAMAAWPPVARLFAVLGLA